MALPNPYPSMRRHTQQGLYPGSGVAQGGNVGRSHGMHMGPPSARAGGVNAKGTPMKPMALPTVKPIAPPKPIAVLKPMAPLSTKPATPTAVPGRPNSNAPAAPPRVVASVIGDPKDPGAGQFQYRGGWYFRNDQGNVTGIAGQQKNTHLLTSAQGLYGLGQGTNLHPYGAPATSATPTAKPPTLALGDLSTHDQAYLNSVAQADLNYNNAGADITRMNAELLTNKPQYDLGVYDYNKDAYAAADANESALAARGAFSSGSHDQADVDRKAAYDKAMNQLSEQYGPAAAARLQAQIDAAEAARTGQRSLDVQGAENTAYQNALANLAANPATAPATTANAASAAAGSASSTPPQSPGVQKYAPKGWTTGKSGWFQQNGVWHFINAEGTIAHNVPAPTGNNTTRVFS